MALSLSALHYVRGAAKGSLTKLESTVNAEGIVFTMEMLTTHENTLNNITKRFNDAQRDIYTNPELTDEQFVNELSEESSFEDRVIAIQIKIKQLLRTAPKVQQSPAQQNSEDNLTQILHEQQRINTSIAQSISKMVEQSNKNHTNSANSFPKLEVAKFSGNYNDWPQFHDHYKSTIHDCSALSGFQKFQYLRTYLTGDAASVISHLGTTEENYEIAWELLQKCYDKKQHIVSSHVESLFTQKKITDAITLRKFINLMRQVLHALDALDVTERDVWIVRLCKPYLDDEMQRLWAREVPSSQVPTLEQFVGFLEEHCDSLEKYQGHNDKISKKSTDKPTGKSTTQGNKPKSSLATTEAKKCAICNESAHKIFECVRFINAAPSQRLDLLRKAKLCINCARHQHSVESCTSSNCRKCNMRHNTLLHEAFAPAVPSTVTTQSADTAAASAPTSPPAVNLMSRQAGQHIAVLPTISLFLIDHDGKRHKVRALLDSCSQPNFITKSLAAKCKIPTYIKHNHTIVGIGTQSTDVATAVKATINSRMHTFAAQCEFSIIDKIVDDQPYSTLTGNWDIPANVILADPEFYKAGRIDMLLGVEVFVQTHRPGKIEGNPTLLETAFGYIVAGDVEVPGSIRAISCICTTSSEPTDTLHKAIEKFWAVEEPGFPKAIRSLEEEECESHFTQHVTRDESGRYIVKLPIKDNLKLLGESRDQAVKRFLCIEKRLLRESQSGIREKYSDFLKEYEQLRHMRKLPQDYQSDKPAVYLPHHPVIKLSSSSTPVRVVFDASAKTSTGISLNDVLMVGPKLQDDIINILLRFRQHNVAIKADISKMFRQIRVADEDQNMQRILWRDSPNKPIETFLLATVTYGTASASYLSIKCIKQLATDEGDSLPLAKQAATNDFYVDDFISGSSSLAAAQELQCQMRELMSRGGFHLTKWKSSDARALKNIPEEDCEKNTQDDLCADNTTKALGVKWDTVHDNFTFSASIHSQLITKRSLLSEISKIYDPIGILSPVVIRAKILMQSLWLVQANWDDDLSDDHHVTTEWSDFLQSIDDVTLISVPRRFTSFTNPKEYHLHVFCDASEKALGSCIYIQTIDERGNTESNLLCAKSKVAPLKKKTIPRLELCAAVLGMRLLELVLESLTINISSVTAYTDSTIVLHWLSSQPQKWKTFVGNRVAEIQQQLPRQHWRHVPSEHNPADVASRGTTSKELANNMLWWHGPDLSHTEDKQLEIPQDYDNEILEQRSTCAISITNDFWNILEVFSCHVQMIRCLTILRRFLKYLKAKVDKTPIDTSPLRVSELNATNEIIIRAIQQQRFHRDLKSLQITQQVEKNSRLTPLRPFLDKNGIIRIWGRIEKSNFPPARKHPILLPDKHYYTKLLARRIHQQTCHGGPQMINNTMRQRYWVLRGLDVAKKTYWECMKCFWTNPNIPDQLMGDLPQDRITPAEPGKRPKVFDKVGVDLCGPFTVVWPIRGLRGPQQRSTKVYVAVFICFISKAIHLEWVSDLTLEAFTAAFERFTGTWGKPTKVFCDNATNFRGAYNRLNEIQKFFSERSTQNDIIRATTGDDVTFHFIPPRTPHFGGLWEAAVKAFKTHFYRVVGKEELTHEQFETLLKKIQMCLNSRPLMPLSSSPGDLETLTPGHFFHGDALNCLPTHDLSDIPQNRLTVWNQIEQMRQYFWQRWSRDILTNMQQRCKWRQPKSNVQVGDLVLLVDDNLPPLAWIRGRIIDVQPGSDKLVRSVDVRTAFGIYRRGIRKIAPFPKDEDQLMPSEVDTSDPGGMSARATTVAHAARRH